MKYLKTPLIVTGSILVLTALMVTFLEPPGRHEPAAEGGAADRGKTASSQPSSPASPAADFRRKIDAAGSGEFKAVANEILNEAPSERRAELMARLLDRWAEQDLTAALDFAANLERYDQAVPLLQHVVRKAGETDFAGVMQWLGRQSMAGPKKQHLLTMLYGKPAEAHPEAALAHVDQLPAGDFKNNVIRKLVGQWAREDPAAAREWLDSRPLDGPLRGLRDSLGGGPPADAPDPAPETVTDKAEQILSMPVGDEKNRLAREYAEELAGENLEAAREWARTLNDPEAYKVALSAVYESWMRTEPDKTVILEELLGESDSGFRDHLINEVALDVASADPAALGEVLDQLPDSAQPDVADKIVRFWKERSPDEAAAWAGRLESGPAKDRANSILVEHYLGRDEQGRALSLIGSVEDSELRYELMKKTAEKWHRSNPDEARKMLAGIPFLSDSEKQSLDAHLQQQQRE